MERPENGATEKGATESKPIARPLPRCPHCGTDPLSITIQQMQLAQYSLLSIFCGNPECRKSLSLQLLAIVPQAGDLVIPGGPMPPAGSKH